MDKKRENGFYWVKYRKEWVVGQWVSADPREVISGRWYMAGSRVYLTDKYFSSIDPTPITREKDYSELRKQLDEFLKTQDKSTMEAWLKMDIKREKQ
jgi:hypothetical protein